MKRFKNKEILEQYLLNCTPTEAYNTILEEQPYYSSTIEKLLAKNNNLINLAIAQSTNEEKLLRKFFAEGDLNLRVAVLENHRTSVHSLSDDMFITGTFENKEQIKDLLFNGLDEELEALLSNKNFSLGALDDLWRKKGAVEDMKKERWEKLVRFSSHNKNIETDTESMAAMRKYDFGLSWYHDHDNISSFWMLFINLENNKYNYYTLSYMLDHIPNFILPREYSKGISEKDSEILNTLTKENKLDIDSVSNNTSFLDTHKESEQNFLIIILNKWDDIVREKISKVFARTSDSYHEYLINHEDKNVRKGVYAFKDFHDESREKIFEYFEKDGREFINGAIANHTLYYSYDNKRINIRNAFHACIFNLRKKDDMGFDYEISLFDKKIAELSNYSTKYYSKHHLSGYDDHILDEEYDKNRDREESFEQNFKQSEEYLQALESNEFKGDDPEILKKFINNYTQSEQLKNKNTKLLYNKITALEFKLKTLFESNRFFEKLFYWVLGGIFLLLFFVWIILYRT
jgi:hypothetical protein